MFIVILRSYKEERGNTSVAWAYDVGEANRKYARERGEESQGESNEKEGRAPRLKSVITKRALTIRIWKQEKTIKQRIVS